MLKGGITMESTPIKLKISTINLVKGQYEGFDYYKIVAETEEGFKLSSKLTAFEYQTLKKGL